MVHDHDNEINRIHSEYKIVKQELDQFKEENKGSEIYREKIIDLERIINENQKVFASKEIVISDIIMEKEKAEQEIIKLNPN